MRTDNIGCLFWGGVGTGKSYLAGCIANALMEKEIPVRMTNFALILNDLAASFEGRNEYISRLCRYPLLILDDFGMERGTEYGLEQVFNVIDSRYRSGKPLIVTTNLTLDDLHNPEDTAHSRIYDRLLSMCVPVRFTGDNNPHGQFRPCRVRLFQERHHNHSRRQNGAGTGSGSRCYTGADLSGVNRGMEKRPCQGA